MGATKRGPNRNGNSTKAADIAPFVILSEANGAQHDNFTARERRGTGMTAFNYLKRQAG